jgi:hypothetical protein
MTLQIQEASFIAGIEDSFLLRISQVINYVLTNFNNPVPVGSIKRAFLTEAQLQAQLGTVWILADGRSTVDGTSSGTPISSTTYGTTFGATSVPDMRGLFTRMKDNGAGINELGDLALGSYQADNVIFHTHSIFITLGNSITSVLVGLANTGSSFAQALPAGAATVVTNLVINASVGLETAPKNVTVNNFIKIN